MTKRLTLTEYRQQNACLEKIIKNLKFDDEKL